MARLYERYKNEIVPALQERFGLGNRMAVPRLEKIVVNMGVGEARESEKRLEAVMKDLATVTGQRAAKTMARCSVAAFKLREGMAIGAKVTLRGRRMYEFLDRLISLVIPRVKDFRGLNPRAFDGRGNFSMGLADQYVYPEIKVDKVEHSQGMDVTICISGESDERSRALLVALGMPFRAEDAAAAEQ